MELETLTKEFETERCGVFGPWEYIEPVSRSCLSAGGQSPGASLLDYDITTSRKDPDCLLNLGLSMSP